MAELVRVSPGQWLNLRIRLLREARQALPLDFWLVGPPEEVAAAEREVQEQVKRHMESCYQLDPFKGAPEDLLSPLKRPNSAT